MEAMERLMAGRTTVMIAHRLGTLEACDVRLEIENGRLAHLHEVGAAGIRASSKVGGVPLGFPA